MLELNTPPLLRAFISSLVRHTVVGLGVALCTSIAAVQPAPAAAQPAKALACAVDPSSKLSAESLCKDVGRALKRPVRSVEDARKESKGEAFQLLRDDVQWTLVFLREGVVNSFVRISIDDAQGQEAGVFARALKVLMRSTPKVNEPCVRVVPTGDRFARAPDVVNPWAELNPCVRRPIDVVDPWWK